jgi:hypothetical protein
MNNSKFNDIGFLSNESVSNLISQQVTNSESYKICIDLNIFAQSVLNHTLVHPDDRKEVYASVYFQRMLSHYQAILLLAERGMTHQLEVILRVMLETLFDLVAFHQHDNFFDALVLGDATQRLAFFKTLREVQKTQPSYTVEELEDLNKVIASAEDIDRSDFKVYIKADLAGMLNEYRTTYALLSETVHSTVHSLEADLVINDNNNEIEAINAYEQKLGNMFTLLMTTANYMIIGLNKILTIAPNAENEARMQKLSDRMQAEWQTVVAVPHR